MNTCSIREKAQEKVFSQLGCWKALKNNGRGVIIGVGGCVASQEGEAIIKRAPHVDLVFGPQTLHRLPELIRQRRESGKSQVDISFPEIEKFDALPEPRAEGASAFVSIMEGCSKYCSFCVVPYTRGTEVSRPFEDVVVEVAQLAAQGVLEINLLGQNVNAYRGPYGDGEFADLGLLIRTIAEIDGVGRIRFTTSHPLEFSDSLIDAYRDVPQLANFLHLPVQAGSDRVLSAMKRGYTALEFKSKIRKLRAVRPDISISSDFIVGFPGETDAEFEKTMKLIEDVGFDQSFSFIYSRRPGTPGRRSGRHHHRCGKARTPVAPAGPDQRAGRGHFGKDGRHRADRAGGRPVQAQPERADRQEREHALGEFPRAPAPGRPVRGCGDHRGRTAIRCARGW